MTKKKISKKRSKVRQTSEIPHKDQVATPPTDDNQFDFGGMPKRDLKKNLGCG
jgi:hypothetical protein